MDVSSVEKSSLMHVTCNIIKELTLERNPMCVRNVGKFSLKPGTLEFMKELMVKRNPMDISTVGEPLIEPVNFSDIKTHTGEEPYECKQ
jgi:hypothetical protein